jgi:hypothetical protein
MRHHSGSSGRLSLREHCCGPVGVLCALWSAPVASHCCRARPRGKAAVERQQALWTPVAGPGSSSEATAGCGLRRCCCCAWRRARARGQPPTRSGPGRTTGRICLMRSTRRARPQGLAMLTCKKAGCRGMHQDKRTPAALDAGRAPIRAQWAVGPLLHIRRSRPAAGSAPAHAADGVVGRRCSWSGRL